MKRIWLIGAALGGVLAVPALLVDSAGVRNGFALASFAVLALAAFILAAQLLQRAAPAEDEDDRTFFNPRAPGQPLPKDSIAHKRGLVRKPPKTPR